MGVTYSIAQVSSYSYSSSIQDSKNITQYNSEIICNGTCTDSISNIYLVIENSNVGNIVFNQECEAKVECYQQNDIEIINNVQMTNTQVSEASANNEVKQSWLGMSASYADIKSQAKNYSLASSYIASYININMGCVSTSVNEISDVIIMIKDSTTGDIEFVQKGSATTSCQSINSAKVSNSVTLVNDQTATAESSNAVGGFGLAGLIALLIIAGIIIASLKVLSNQSKNQQQQCKNEPGKPGCGPPPIPMFQPPGIYPPPSQYPIIPPQSNMNQNSNKSNNDKPKSDL